MERAPCQPEVIERERYEFDSRPPYHFALDRRQFFKMAGGGVAVFLLLNGPAELAGQQERRGRRSGHFERERLPDNIGAWLHIGETGAVTVYTGKAEMGQNIRTSLAQAVAGELRVAFVSVSLVMADTLRTPFDMGTFGSRTTPQMGSELRRVASVARDLMVEMAAKRWKINSGGLVAADGAITDPKTGRRVEYAELAKGQSLATAVIENDPVTPASKWTVAGKPIPKAGGKAFVTGRHRFSPDIKRPGMHYGKVLRPPEFGSTIASLDDKAARAIAAVKVVRDGDFAGVTAPGEEKAKNALATLKAVWKPAAGLQISDRDLFRALTTSGGAAAPGREGGSRDTGSIETGLAQAPHRLKQTFSIAYIAHAPLETRAAVAEWNDGKVTVWTGTQRPFAVREQVAEAFRIPEESVRVIVPDTGGAYGGKHTGEAAVEAARLAKAAGRPVSLQWTREEEFTWAYFRPAGVMEITSGALNDGTLTAWEFHNYNSGEAGINTPYDVPNQRIEFHPAEAPLRQGSYRCLAATGNQFARESHMDDVARSVKMDPLEFRRKNLKDPRLLAVLDAAASAFGWGKKAPPGRGYGIACGTEKGGYLASCAEIAVDRETRNVKVVRVVSAFECGAIVNPDGLKNQVEGAAIMGLGGALFEAIHFERGRILNDRFSLYRVPRFSDVPGIRVVLIDRKDLPSAGAGEAPIMCVAPAIRNAILDATGIRLYSMPMAPDGLPSA
ncbi:MAG: xanthine dehydrogenase family protein molybdopterin-binding subunit [Acidobacteriota bacterium]|nr:xanthine dehydrogenase family protein molybdopterin-binding subunit [Acidobacteriota bacterium]